MGRKCRLIGVEAGLGRANQNVLRSGLRLNYRANRFKFASASGKQAEVQNLGWRRVCGQSGGKRTIFEGCGLSILLSGGAGADGKIYGHAFRNFTAKGHMLIRQMPEP